MQIGIVGLGRMGGNMAHRLMRGGHQCAVFDLNSDNIALLEGQGATAAASLEDLVAKLARPRTVWVMVPAGDPAESVIMELARRMETGDTVIDGGNSYYKDTMNRAKKLAKYGIRFLDCGTSGGPGGALRALVGAGLETWRAQFLYGEFRGDLVTDSLAADVIVVWADSVPPDVAPDTTGATGACGGLTSFTVDSSNTMEGPVHVEVRVNPGFTLAQVAACLPRVTRHELGHALGILTHSPDPADLMDGTPSTSEPSAADRATVEVLYHTPPTIAPPRR